MSTEQPEALRLAAALDALLGYRGINPDVGKAAAELRRLQSVNVELLEALQLCKELAKIVRELCTAYGHPLPAASLDRSDAAIAKATKE